MDLQLEKFKHIRSLGEQLIEAKEQVKTLEQRAQHAEQLLDLYRNAFISLACAIEGAYDV